MEEVTMHPLGEDPEHTLQTSNRSTEINRNVEKVGGKSKGALWSHPMHLIAFGIIFGGLGFDFWYLRFLFPLLGILLLFFGVRQLREENVHFKRAWIFTVVLLFFVIAVAILDVPGAEVEQGTGFYYFIFFIGFAQLILGILLRGSLHQAVKEVYSRAAQKAPKRSFGDSIILLPFGLPMLLRLAGSTSGGYLLLIVFFVLNIYVFHFLYRLGTKRTISWSVKSRAISSGMPASTTAWRAWSILGGV